MGSRLRIEGRMMTERQGMGRDLALSEGEIIG